MSVVRLWQALLLSLLLGALSLWLALPDLPATEPLRVLARLTLPSVLLIAAPILGWWLFSSVRLMLLVDAAGGRLTAWQGVQAHVAGAFTAAATPSGGGNMLGVAFVLTRYGLSAQDAVAVTILCLVGDLAFFAWAVPAAFWLLRSSGLTLPFAELGAVVALLSVAAALISWLLAFRLALVTRLLERLARLPYLRRFAPRWERFLAGLTLTGERFSARPWGWHLRFHLVSSAARLSYFLVLNMVIVALAVRLPHLGVYSLQVLAHSVAHLIPTPGGSGYQEAVMTFALRGRAPFGAVAAVVIAWRFFQHYLYFLIGPLVGGLLLALPQRSRRTRLG